MIAPKPKATPSPVELARVAVEQQTRLRDDVTRRHAASSAARDSADRALAEARQAHAVSMGASANARANDKLADDAARVGIRAAHAARDFDDAAKAHSELSAELQTAQSNLDSATAKLYLEQLSAELAVDEVRFHREARESAKGVVLAVEAILSGIQAMRANLAAHNSRLAAYHAAGGSLELRPRDGTASAGLIYAELHEAGGCLHVTHTPHELRYLLDLPTTTSAFANPFEVARLLSRFLIDSLEQASKKQRTGDSTYRRAELARAAEIFSSSRDRVEAAEKLGQADSADETARNAAAERAHRTRLDAAATASKRSPPGRATRADGSLIGPPLPDEPPDLTVG